MKKYKLNIPAALQQRNLTRRALAKRMKVTEPSVTSYIQGNPTIDKIYAIAEALECSVLDLFFPEESSPAASAPSTLKRIAEVLQCDVVELFDEPLHRSLSRGHSAPPDRTTAPIICPHCGTLLQTTLKEVKNEE